MDTVSIGCAEPSAGASTGPHAVILMIVSEACVGVHV